MKVSAQEADSAYRTKNQFVPYPVVGNAPETGFQFGFGAIYTFFINHDPRETRNSFIYSFNMWTAKQQQQYAVQASVWLPKNIWNFTANGIYTDYPLFFYGVGSDTKQSDEDLITSKRFKILTVAKHKIIKDLYAGVGLWVQNDNFSAADSTGIFNTGDYYGKQGGNSMLIGFGGAFDNRDYENSTTTGSYFSLLEWISLGINNYKFHVFNLDARHFFRFDATKCAGIQFVYQTAQGSATPFYYLPFIGGDQILRGYYVGRYRDQHMLATQAEFRYRPWGKQKDHGWFSLSRLSLAGFAGTGMVFSNGEFNFSNLKPNYGGGFRYMFEPTARMILRFDYGVGSKNPGEKRSTGFYISLNEAF
ncbi:hypothetical protein NF867_17155 [Solitalea sp. MAHUQ-68]|uniref:Bacterial surface antigen (D15) domain-containing protein n=1 Tax=Solitalea agri TaxID=2953739 RepID=A0A9X2JEC2_9SPHI|nr:hypothetical protein [Solitalea agri]